MPRRNPGLPEFVRARERVHTSGLIFISDAELEEQGLPNRWGVGLQLVYNGVVYSVRGISMYGILIWKLGERGPV